MNKELLIFLSRLPHEDLNMLPDDAILVNFWVRAAEAWNDTHEPVRTTVRDVEEAFRLRWPQIYGGINGTELYLSFSYIDYLFTENEDGTVSGGIFIRGGEKPTVRLNMTPVQIVELAMALRVCPFDEEELKDILSEYDEEEVYIDAYSRYEYRNTSHPMPESEALHQKAIHMEGKASCLYVLGYYEEALEWFQKSLIVKHYAELGTGIQYYNDYAYQLMGCSYDSILDSNMAETCYQYAADDFYKRVKENPDEDKEDAWSRFQKWADKHSQFLSRNGWPGEAKRIENMPDKYMRNPELRTLSLQDWEDMDNSELEIQEMDILGE